MLTNDFLGNNVSRLGFGAMRLPLGEDKLIDPLQTQEMVDYAIAHGVNYFDTAWPYHNGTSELVMGECLKKYPRGSFYLANKFPGHQVMDNYDPAPIFEKQLQKCQVEYFDYYLLHNVCENSLPVYEDDSWGIVEYFIKQKELGRIRHLGFSSHARTENLEYILDRWGDVLEFCQIQLNYLDWTLQDAKTKYELLTKRGIPVIVMEPLRGGKLCALPEEHMARLEALRPGMTAAAWSLQFLKDLPNVAVTLSGMSNLQQMKENVETYETGAPLTEAEREALFTIAESMKNALPCTGCRYCTEGCPMELDIPLLISAYNDLNFSRGGFTVGMQMDALPADKLPSACISCGACAAICPQQIDIPVAMQAFTELLASTPKWADVCREREEAARKLAGK